MEQKPTEREDEYFAQLEFDRKKKIAEEHQQKLDESEKKKYKDLHHMRCPECGMQLVDIDYREIKVHKCTACEGVWLSSREFESILELEHSAIGRLFSLFKK
jgi:hypothetical protein